MTILVAYAPFDESRAALDEAIRLARLSQEDIVVVNATPGGDHKHHATVDEQERERVQQVLDASGLRTEFRQFARGRSTVEEIRDLAAELDPSLVVVGIRRRGSFGKFLMGSVTDDVLKEIDQPVLCVKEPLRPARTD